MKHKVLILGSAGLIGHQIYFYLKNKSDFQLSNISYSKKLQNDTILLDARDQESLTIQIKNINPDFVVNCIGSLIENSNRDPQSAIMLNAYLPHKLVNLAHEIGFKLIHMSTDCVFSGEKRAPYIETDFKDGRDIYAKTKGLGEIINNNHLTLRTSVVGPELKSSGGQLFNWFMNQSSSINGYSTAFWSGVTTIELAKAVKWTIDNEITGLYHITNNQSISKNNLLRLFKKYTKKNIEIIPLDLNNLDKSFIDTRKLIDYEIPSYELMVRDMVKLISENKELYSQYKFGKNFEF